MSRNGVEFLKIQKYVFKVHIHCQGCQQKVKKLLRKIEGVYSVNIDAENQLVIVSGSVDSATLIKKLERSGKHAEHWSPSSYQKLYDGQANFIADDHSRINGLNASKTEHIFPTFLGNDQQKHCSLQNYLNENNIGTTPVSGEIDQNLMTVTMEKNTYMGGAYVDPLATEDDIKMNFSGRTAYEYELSPSMMMDNTQQLNQYNLPPTEMMHTTNMIDNLNYMHQNHMMNYKSSAIPSFADFGFSYAPYTLY